MTEEPADEYIYPEGCTERDEWRHLQTGCDHGPRSNAECVADMRVVLGEAIDVVTGPRNQRYGPPSVNHARTAAIWSAWMGFEITASDVCALNILQKLSRQRHSQTRDNAVDIAGFAANMWACRDET